MKLKAKPISSPSRTDNFPPPLLRFLRSNGGSKSRGRSRSSPLFIRKKSEIQSNDVITQEPSSPEVTCMGQVRGTVSKNKRKKKINKKSNRCEWIQNTLFCRHLDRTNSTSNPKSKKSKKPVWRRWGARKKLEIKEDSSSFTPVKPEEFDTEEESVIGEDEEEIETFVTKAPPKNALLLMRCRSEPYRASSLANRFWGSPNEGTEKKVEEELKTEHSCRESVQESRLDTETEMKMGFCQGLESSSSTKNSAKMEAEISKPVVLQRCKSEPARRSEKFQPDMCFWKKRLEFDDISNSTTRF
ncbi:hypothetical protein ACHQM5_021844 [Ranunculus cassubicifolius]